MTIRYYDLPHRAMTLRLDIHTSIEQLQLADYYHTAVIPYHDYVIFGIWHGDNQFSSAVYRFDTDDHAIDAPITMVYLHDRFREFSDMGDAVKEGILRAEVIHSEELMKRKV